MLRHTSITQTRLAQFGERFIPLIYPEKVPFQIEVAGPVDRISRAEAQKLTYAPAKRGMLLGPLWATYWFRLQGKVPEAWAGKRVDLLWISHSEATLWREGQPVQGLNFEPANLWNKSVRPDAQLWKSAPRGGAISLEVEVACNSMFGYDFRDIPFYPTVTPFIFEQADLALFDEEAWQMRYDYLVLADLVCRAKPEALTPWEGRLLEELNAFVNQCIPEDRATWPAARKRLQALYQNHNATYQHELSAIGHAHIDTAWLWPLAETRRKCVRTFSSATTYFDDYPEYKFACSQAQQYAWIKEEQPALYEKIKKAVKKGQWFPVGGTWIEPDCNIPSGESLVRQFLVGKRFFQKEFGVDCKEFWNPDVFGYSGALPQIMKGVGIDYFLTQKLSWNQFNKPLHHNFYWEGIDGSRILTHFPPADTYNGLGDGFPHRDLLFNVTNFKDHDRSNQSMFLFGYGDGGGGPTKEMLEVLRRVKDLQGLPRTEQRSPQEFFKRLEERLVDAPVVSGELYFELHRGTYTTQAANKRDNRRSEFLLRNIELIATLAHVESKAAYPTEALDALWKTVLLNQFHDIIPGSSIRQVYEDTARDYARIFSEGEALLQKALGQLPAATVPALFNSCGWERHAIVETPTSLSAPQKSYRGQALIPVNLPSMGRAPLQAIPVAVPVTASEAKGLFILENGLLRAEFSKAGTLTRLFDKKQEREVLAPNAAANQFVLFDDRPQNWDAWEVDAYHLETRQPLPAAKSIRILENGPVRAGLELEIVFGESRITQRLFLAADAAQIEFECEVDWHQRHQFLKVEFPTALHAPEASYEIQFGHLKRPTHFNTTYDIARFESCGHKWVDLSQPDYGVALLTDSKYGYAIHGSTMRISLLRAPTHPDPEADQGLHHFRFACYPHAGDLIAGEVVRHAYEFNCPPLLTTGDDKALSYFTVDSPHLVIDTVKKAEDSDAVIVRLYECHGTSGKARLQSPLPFKSAEQVNLLEEPQRKLDWQKGSLELAFKPFEILTISLKG